MTPAEVSKPVFVRTWLWNLFIRVRWSCEHVEYVKRDSSIYFAKKVKIICSGFFLVSYFIYYTLYPCIAVQRFSRSRKKFNPKHKQIQTRCCFCVEKLRQVRAGLHCSASGNVHQNRGAFIWAGSKSKLRAEAKYWHMAKLLPFVSDLYLYAKVKQWNGKRRSHYFWLLHTSHWLWGKIVRLQNARHFLRGVSCDITLDSIKLQWCSM